MYIENNCIMFELTDYIKTDGADLFALKGEQTSDVIHLCMDEQVQHEKLKSEIVKAMLETVKQDGNIVVTPKSGRAEEIFNECEKEQTVRQSQIELEKFLCENEYKTSLNDLCLIKKKNR